MQVAAPGVAAVSVAGPTFPTGTERLPRARLPWRLPLLQSRREPKR